MNRIKEAEQFIKEDALRSMNQCAVCGGLLFRLLHISRPSCLINIDLCEDYFRNKSNYETFSAIIKLKLKRILS